MPTLNQGIDQLKSKGRKIRLVLYSLLIVWSILLGIFTIARLVYTLSPRGDDFLFGGNPFYDPVVVELMICALFGIIFGGLMVWVHKVAEARSTFSRNWFEVLCLALLFFLWLGGAAGSTDIWPDLSFCVQFSQCRILQAMIAWAWLGLITLSIILFPTLFFVIKNSAWDGHCFDCWTTTSPPENFELGREQQEMRMPPSPVIAHTRTPTQVYSRDFSVVDIRSPRSGGAGAATVESTYPGFNRWMTGQEPYTTPSEGSHRSRRRRDTNAA